MDVLRIILPTAKEAELFRQSSSHSLPFYGDQRHIFNDIPLSTLRFVGGPFITGVNYQIEKKFFRFDEDSICENTNQNYFSCDPDNSNDEKV
uniref:Uncharacterized protein n=1 Tax=Onchocerca volvulus TaxID=6282 RepID=A0A8R1XQ08_ONCVO